MLVKKKSWLKIFSLISKLKLDYGTYFRSKTAIVGHKEIFVQCFLLNDTGLGACGDGIWTLAMKIDGRKVFSILTF